MRPLRVAVVVLILALVYIGAYMALRRPHLLQLSGGGIDGWTRRHVILIDRHQPGGLIFFIVFYPCIEVEVQCFGHLLVDDHAAHAGT
jgi:hypothetical protein